MDEPKLMEAIKSPPKEDSEMVDTANTGEGVTVTSTHSVMALRYYPDCNTADWRFHLTLPNIPHINKEGITSKLLLKIQTESMAPLYMNLCQQLGWDTDTALLANLEKQNERELAKLKAVIEDARDNFGDSEIREALLEMAHFYCRIGDKANAIEAYDICYAKTLGSGGRLDIILTLVRLGLFFNDVDLVKKNLARAKEELKNGGDWERRNKLKVYEGILLMMTRNFKEAAELFLSCIATFTATELIAFDRFVFFAVVVSLVALDRPALREKVVNSPEVLQVAQEDPVLKAFMMSFYSGDYCSFMDSLSPMMERIHQDRYLHCHYRYLVRHLRLKAYQQFLEPFKSVTLEAMAEAFGISVKMMESQVAEFIGTGKLSCRIDLVGGIVESNRPDMRNDLYLQTIKQVRSLTRVCSHHEQHHSNQGDILLNRIQKLSRVIDM